MLCLFKKSNGFSLLALTAFFTTLFSFSVKPGGEGFEIYLGNKLMLHQFGSQMDAVKTIPLEQGLFNDQLSIKYYHCGRVGKNRVITIKDGQNKIVKEWHFADASGSDISMNCKVKDILSLHFNQLKLYYSSMELPNGRLLASIILNATARRN